MGTILNLATIFVVLFLSVEATVEFKNAIVEFQLPCNNALCSENQVSELIDQLETITGSSVSIIKIWKDEISLLMCHYNEISSLLNKIETNSVEDNNFQGITIQKVQYTATLRASVLVSFLSFAVITVMKSLL